MNEYFVPLALDSYFRGNATELEFCEKIKAGGNHLTAATASGYLLHRNGMRLRRKELSGVYADFNRLAESERRPKLASDESKPKREMPSPPGGGLIVKAYCSYLQSNSAGNYERAKTFYYKNNPDRWAVESQSDMLWLTKEERESLVPSNASVGQTVEVAVPIQDRFFSTIGIDFMEGSVSSLPLRDSTMTLTVTSNDKGIRMKLEGSGQMGKPMDEQSNAESHSRGCEILVIGDLHIDEEGKFDQFNLAGVGRAWGNKRKNTQRIIGVEGSSWLYGIACEIVAPQTPADQIPPYNLLHYNGSGKSYFPKR